MYFPSERLCTFSLVKVIRKCLILRLTSAFGVFIAVCLSFRVYWSYEINSKSVDSKNLQEIASCDIHGQSLKPITRTIATMYYDVGIFAVSCKCLLLSFLHLFFFSCYFKSGDSDDPIKSMSFHELRTHKMNGHVFVRKEIIYRRTNCIKAYCTMECFIKCPESTRPEIDDNCNAY